MRPVQNNSKWKFTKSLHLTITDICSRFTKIKIINDLQAKTTARVFETIWLKNFKKPTKVIADRGTQFTSNIFFNLMTQNEIKISYCSPNNATGNCKSERISRQINEILGIFYKKKHNCQRNRRNDRK